MQFGALQVTARACYTRPPTEATNTDAFVDVDEVTLKGEIKRIFTGWMFASSPGLHAVEHPIYDVWLTDCAQPVRRRRRSRKHDAARRRAGARAAPPAPAASPAPPVLPGTRAVTTLTADHPVVRRASTVPPGTGRSSASAPKSPSPTSAASSSL